MSSSSPSLNFQPPTRDTKRSAPQCCNSTVNTIACCAPHPPTNTHHSQQTTTLDFAIPIPSESRSGTPSTPHYPGFPSSAERAGRAGMLDTA